MEEECGSAHLSHKAGSGSRTIPYPKCTGKEKGPGTKKGGLVAGYPSLPGRRKIQEGDRIGKERRAAPDFGRKKAGRFLFLTLWSRPGGKDKVQSYSVRSNAKGLQEKDQSKRHKKQSGARSSRRKI